MEKELFEDLVNRIEQSASTATNIEVLVKYIDSTLENVEQINFDAPYYNKNNLRKTICEYTTNARHLCWIIEDFAKQSSSDLFSAFNDIKGKIYELAK